MPSPVPQCTTLTMWQFFAVFGVFLALIAYINKWYRKAYIDQFTSKCVFITGTDSGFGLALALDLDKCGVKVYAGCFTKEGAKNLKQLASNKLKTISIDITKEDSVNEAKEAIETDLEPGQELWGLVNNAGIMPNGQIFFLSKPEDFRLAMEVNFFGTMNVTNAFWPLLKRSHGRIVNVISMAGRCSVGIEPYTCSKHALEPYTDGLRRWMKNFGTHVAIIEPGIFKCTNLNINIANETNLKRNIKNGAQSVRLECGDKVFDAATKVLGDFYATAPLTRWNKASMVTNSMKHALFAKHPKDRYVCGYDGKYVYRLLANIPDWLLDFIVEYHMQPISCAIKNG